VQESSLLHLTRGATDGLEKSFRGNVYCLRHCVTYPCRRRAVLADMFAALVAGKIRIRGNHIQPHACAFGAGNVCALLSRVQTDSDGHRSSDPRKCLRMDMPQVRPAMPRNQEPLTRRARHENLPQIFRGRPVENNTSPGQTEA
jgi:hypothetical protein